MTTELNKIAVGVTTFQRPDVFGAWLKMFDKFTAHGIDFYVVEDYHEGTPYTDKMAKERRGVAGAKNDLLKEIYAKDYRHVFLFDDDTMPRAENWWKPFCQSGVAHLNYMPNLEGHLTLEPLPGFPGVASCSMLWGCLVYLDRALLSKDYWFDERYKLYGHEHTHFSREIFRGRDIPHINLTLIDIDKLIYSFDYDWKWCGEQLPYPEWTGEYKALMDNPTYQAIRDANFHHIYKVS